MEINLVSPNGTGIITESVECLPKTEVLEAMLKDGFKLIVDGKKLNKSEASAFVKEMRK